MCFDSQHHIFGRIFVKWSLDSLFVCSTWIVMCSAFAVIDDDDFVLLVGIIILKESGPK